MINKKGDVGFLGQLVDSMSDAVERLEWAKERNNLEDFNKLKGFILDVQDKIDGELS